MLLKYTVSLGFIVADQHQAKELPANASGPKALIKNASANRRSALKLNKFFLVIFSPLTLVLIVQETL